MAYTFNLARNGDGIIRDYKTNSETADASLTNINVVDSYHRRGTNGEALLEKYCDFKCRCLLVEFTNDDKPDEPNFLLQLLIKIIIITKRLNKERSRVQNEYLISLEKIQRRFKSISCWIIFFLIKML